MKRTALERSTPLRSRKRMVRRKPRRLDRPGADPGYVAFVHRRPCVCSQGKWTACAGRIEQSHARNLSGPTGAGRKEKDANSVPMCTRHHRQWDGYTGDFRYWSRDARRQWMIGWISREHAAYAAQGGRLAQMDT